jgi:protein-S-isoprenylcysteine O-methyltransferase Ste14
MTLEQLLDWLPLVVLIATFSAARIRAWAMHRRGVRVVIVDWNRPLKEMLYDVLVIVAFLCWLYFLVAEAWPLSLAFLPGWLTKNLIEALPVRLIGAAMLLSAPTLFAASLISFANSWRIGIDREQPPPLVTGGIFGCTRNPIYTAFDLIIIGAFLVHGRAIFLLFGVVLVLLIHGVVLREEQFLEDQFGDSFRDYRQKVRRYGLL